MKSEVYAGNPFGYSIRPAVNINDATYVIDGDGTYDNPYRIGDLTPANENDNLSDRAIGEYVVYSGYKMVISDKDRDGNVKLTMLNYLRTSGKEINIKLDNHDRIIFDPSDTDNFGYVANNDIINYLDQKYIVEHDFDVVEHDRSKKYTEFKKDTYKIKVSLPVSYEMFGAYFIPENEADSIYLVTDYSLSNDKIMYVNPGTGLLFEDSGYSRYGVKFTMWLRSNIKIKSGNGTYYNPYILK